MRRWRFVKVWFKDQMFILVRKTKFVSDRWMLFTTIISFFVVVYNFGFYTTPSWENFIQWYFPASFMFYFLVYLFRVLFFLQQKTHNWRRYLDYLIAVILFVSADIGFFHPRVLIDFFPWLGFLESAVYKHTLTLLIFAIEVSRGTLSLYRIRFNPSLLYAGSFFFLIIIGCGLLMLPRASHEPLDFLDALFTSTSAVCVTGLIVVDTSTQFTALGQGILLLLFQVGGLGVMIFTSFFGFFFQGSPTFQDQLFLKDIVNEEKLGRILRTLYKILTFTFSVELAGALMIYMFQAQPNLGFQENLWNAVFHSVSAFCNAGFSVFTGGLNDISAGTFRNYNLHLVVAILIIIGGIGFPVVINYFSWINNRLTNISDRILRGRVDHKSLHLLNVNTRIVTITTLLLLVLGTVGYWLIEYRNTLHGMSFYGQLVTSFFGAVTPRTAGFNTVDHATLLTPALLLTIFLMWVGASPSSTGGGIKTSTLALAIFNITSMAKGKERVDIFRRNIRDRNVRRAFAVIILSIVAISTAIFILTITDGQLGLKNIVFECVSAFSTVGLSLGITAQLSSAGKVVLCALMFAGRIGTLTIVVAFFRKLHSYQFQYPQEQIFIN